MSTLAELLNEPYIHCSKEDAGEWYVQMHHEEEYKEYSARTPMSRQERKALQQWVRAGHSVYEAPCSRYLPGSSTSRAFLDVYREDSLLDHALEGKTPEQQRRYLMEYMGWEEETKEEKEKRAAREANPDIAREHICRQARQIFYLWEFLAGEGLSQEAREYLEEHMDEPTPFEYDF